MTDDRQAQAFPALWEDFRRRHSTDIAAAIQECDYVVALARRNFNLLFTDGELILDKPGARSRLMTDNALLLQHRKIVEHYHKNHRFPQIFVSDDVLIHGRGLSWLLETLWSLLLGDLLEDGALSDDEIYDIQRDFLCALHIHVYACNKREIILEDRYRRRLSYSQSFYAVQLREFTSVSCDALYADEDVVNTSFVFSARLPGWTDLPPDGWERTAWTFEEKFNSLDKANQVKRMTVYVRRSETETPRWVSTIRHKDLPGQPADERLVTSLVLFGQLPEESVRAACRQAAALLEDARYPALAEILRQNQRQLARVRMQLLSFFASVITFFDFAGDLPGGAAEILAHSDLDKISLNFGSHDEMYPELSSICADAALREALRAVIFSCLDQGAALELPPPREPLTSRLEERMTEAGKDLMGRLGAQAEAAAYQPGAGNAGLKIGRITFTEYLKDVRRSEPVGGWVNEIAAFLFLMESGVMGMNVCSDAVEGAHCCVAKAGEKATFALAEPIAVELPALALVERECWRLNLTVKDALAQFVPLLRAADGAALDAQTQRELLDACRRLYACGHSLTGWDFEALTEQRTPEKRKRQSDCLAQARAFLRMS